MNKKQINTSNPFYTIGYSICPVDEFIDILLSKDINLVVDVRSLPGSNKNPQYNKERLAETLKKYKIKYKHIPKLGGLRSNSKIPSNINAFWKNKSFHNYADYALSDDFKEGLEELINLGFKYQCVIMCGEVLWWRCHRRIITDYLLINNKKVYHIFDSKNIKEASITNGAKKDKFSKITYSIK